MPPYANSNSPLAGVASALTTTPTAATLAGTSTASLATALADVDARAVESAPEADATAGSESAADVSMMRPGATRPASVPPEVVPDASANAAPPGGCTFEQARADSTDDIERRFVDGIEAGVRAGEEWTWAAHGPCFRSALLATGITAEEAQGSSRLQVVLLRLAHHLRKAPTRWRNKYSGELGQTTFMATLRRKLDELPHGTRIARHGETQRASFIALAKLLELSLDELYMNGRAEVQARIDDGRLVLGDPFRRTKAFKTERARLRLKVLAKLERFADPDDPKPLPLKGASYPKVDLDPTLDELGITDPDMREALKHDKPIRERIAELRKLVGGIHAVTERPKTPEVSFADLKAAVEQVRREVYREKHPNAEPGCQAESEYAADEVGKVSRAMLANGWADASPVEQALLGENSAANIAKGCNGNGGDRNYLAAMGRTVTVAAQLVDARANALTFGQRLRSGIMRKGMSIAKFAKACDVCASVMGKWCNDLVLPSVAQLHIVHRAEDRLGYGRNTLVDLLGATRTGRNRSGRQSITLSDGRTRPMRRYLRFLPFGALEWGEERLRAYVDRLEVTHYGSKTVNSVRQRAAVAETASLPPLDRTAPIFDEWKDLKRFKTNLNDAERFQSPKYRWNSSKTVEKHLAMVESFARWATMPRHQGGLGLAARQVSFALFLNHQVVQKFVFYRVQRWRHLSIDGKELGAMLGGTEKAFLGFVKSLLHCDWGWLTQSRDVVRPPEVIDVSFPLEEMTALDHNLVVSLSDDAVVCTVMSEALVERIASDWSGAIRKAKLAVAALEGQVAAHYKMIRNPHDLVNPILRHDSPVGCVIQMVMDSLRRAPSIDRCRVQHARAYRDAVAMLLLVTVVFRSETMRDMEWRADGTGNLVRTAEGYDVVVGAERFKNGLCRWLFGPSWRRRDYERELASWGGEKGLTAILDYYLETCRPILLKGRDTDLLFPTGLKAEKWDHKTFNTMITNWTRVWSVRNEASGTGMEGVLPWGPHCVRDIVATHVILHHEGEGRWEMASALLGASVEVVKLHYSWVEAKRELNKANPMYADAFRLGMGAERLF